MHTFYKEHNGSYAVGVPWPTTIDGTPHMDWHTLFSGLSLATAMRTVNHLNGGDGLKQASDKDFSLLLECVD